MYHDVARMIVGRIGNRVSSPGGSGSSRLPWFVAGSSFAFAAASFLAGGGRSYGYDESLTVGAFVATPSLLDPFRRQIVFNNHPLFSFLEHLVWSIGGQSEMWMRLLPAMFGAACVAVLGGWLTRRWGVWAGFAGAAILIAHPLFSGASRSVRGYSLLCLCAVVSTLLAIEMVEGGSRRRWSILYVLMVGAGIAVHLYMVFVLAGQVVFVAVSGAVSERWRIRWYGGVLLGAVAHLGMISTILAAARHRGRVFRPEFPLDLGQSLLGSQPAITVALVGAVLPAALACVRRRELVLPAATVAAMLGIVWTVLAPVDLYPRFFVWLVPGLAALGALGVARWRPVMVPAGLAVLAMIAVQVDQWPKDHRSLPRAAAVVDAARARNQRPCAIGGEALAAYTRIPPEASPDPSGCDLVVRIIPTGEFEGRTTFPRVERLGPGVSVFHR